jgi:hypothetical protein
LVNVVSLAYKILTANHVLIMQPKGRTADECSISAGGAIPHLELDAYAIGQGVFCQTNYVSIEAAAEAQAEQ